MAPFRDMSDRIEPIRESETSREFRQIISRIEQAISSVVSISSVPNETSRGYAATRDGSHLPPTFRHPEDSNASERG